MPLISIIIPVYNVEKYIDKCIDEMDNFKGVTVGVKSKDTIKIASNDGMVFAFDLHGTLSKDQIFAPLKETFDKGSLYPISKSSTTKTLFFIISQNTLPSHCIIIPWQLIYIYILPRKSYKKIIIFIKNFPILKIFLIFVNFFF